MDFSHTRSISTASVMSPTTSVFSKGHSSKSSQSSISASSSPLPARDSLDTPHTSKLENVWEEADTYREHCSFDDYARIDSGISLEHPYSTSPALREPENWSSSSSSGPRHLHRQRSASGPTSAVANDIVSRIGSLSRRWRNKSAAGPHLSIITHNAPLPARATSPVDQDTDTLDYSFTRCPDPDFMPPSPIRSIVDEYIHDSEMVPICIDNTDIAHDQEAESQHATTPLLPPLMMGLRKQDSPIQSPLQSPSIAPANYLPSPPLSTQPSVSSIHHTRPRVNTTANTDVPPLYLYNEDRWAMSLGHADFSIHPEPYSPDSITWDSYTEFRANWDQARKQYAQHLARTIEHYGNNSKVFKLTEDKWQSIDDCWKRYNSLLSAALTPVPLSAGPNSPDSASSPLEKPATRVVVPPLDAKWPMLGDNDIVGPMGVGEARVKELQRNQRPMSPGARRRSLRRAISDMLTRH